MTNLRRRILGVGLLLATALLYDTASPGLLHRLLIPGAMALGAWLVVQNLAAVLFAVTFIAVTVTNVASAEILPSRVYPGVALLAGCGLGAIGLSRFRTRIHTTRAERWRHRSTGEHPPR